MEGKIKCWECEREIDLTTLPLDEEDLIRCPSCHEPVGINAIRVRVVKVPEGPAPLEFRKAWVGLELFAKVTPLKGPEVDFITEEMIIRKPPLMVPVYPALKRLEQKNPEAADWFRTYFPPEMQHFTFGADEVEILEMIRVGFWKFYHSWKYLLK